MAPTSTITARRFRKMPALRLTSRRFARLTVAAAIVTTTTLLPTKAQAALNIYLFNNNGGQLTIESRGTVQLGSGSGSLVCGGGTTELFADPGQYYICPQSGTQPAYSITFLEGNQTWGTNTSSLSGASVGTEYSIASNLGLFATDLSSGSSISSTTTFASNSIAQLGLIGSGPRLLVKYQIDETPDTISIFADTPLPPDPSPVPAPVPVLGAAGVFAWSRRLRRRINQSRQR